MSHCSVFVLSCAASRWLNDKGERRRDHEKRGNNKGRRGVDAQSPESGRHVSASTLFNLSGSPGYSISSATHPRRCYKLHSHALDITRSPVNNKPGARFLPLICSPCSKDLHLIEHNHWLINETEGPRWARAGPTRCHHCPSQLVPLRKTQLSLEEETRGAPLGQADAAYAMTAATRFSTADSKMKN